MKNGCMIFMAAALTMAALTLGGCGLAKNNGDAGQEAQRDQDAGLEVGTGIVFETVSDPAYGSEDTVFKNMKTTDFDGNQVDSSIFSENKLTLVNIWGVFCTPCVEEIPELAKLSKDYEGKDVAIKGMIYEMRAGLSDEIKAEAEKILEGAGADYQQLMVSDEMNAGLLGIQFFPTTYFVDSDGGILQKIEGSNDYDGWNQAIEECLEKIEAQ